MSLLPCSTFAGPSQAEALWAVAGSVGPGGGVTQLVAGTGVTLDPSTGEGVVTINATGGGGGVSSVTASGAGITATPTTGAVVVANTGVTSMVAGTGISLSGASGAVTVTNTFASGVPTLTYVTSAPANPNAITPVAADVIKLTLPYNSLIPNTLFNCFIWREGWASTDVFTISVAAAPVLSGSRIPGVATAQYSAAGLDNRLSVNYQAVSDSSAASNPVVWIIRYAGISV